MKKIFGCVFCSVLLCLMAGPVFAEEPLVLPQQECQAALEFNKTDYMRMRDQFVKMAITADALKAKLDKAEKDVERVNGQLQEELGKRIGRDMK